MGSGRGRQRRAQQTQTISKPVVKIGKNWEEAGLVLLTNPQNKAERNIFQQAKALGAQVLIDDERGTWEAVAQAHTAPKKSYIFTAPLTSPLRELVAMHELGHIFHKHRVKCGSPDELRCEREAWEWALASQQDELSPDLKTSLGMVMLRRVLVSQRLDGYPIPKIDDPCWDLVRLAERVETNALPGELAEETREWLTEIGLSDGVPMEKLVSHLTEKQAPAI